MSVEKFQELKDRVQQLKESKARLESKIETLEARKKELLESLRRDFGVSSPDEVRAKISALEAEIEEGVRVIEEKLKEVDTESKD